MDEGTLKIPIPSCRLYWSLCLGFSSIEDAWPAALRKTTKIRENENEKRKSCNLSKSASRKQRDIGLNIFAACET